MALIERSDVRSGPPGAGSAAQAWRRALEMTAPIVRHPARTFPDVIDDMARRCGAALALVSETESLTFQELSDLSRRYGDWAVRHGIVPGDVVGLLMANSPHYLAIWLGIIRIGGVAALINTNLVGDSLAHSISTVAPRHLIAGVALAEPVAALGPRLAPGIEVWTHGGTVPGLRQIEDALDDRPTPADPGRPRPTIADRALYIYTSGTTGLPKAAAVSHYRLMQWSHWFAGLMDIAPDDRMYCCLPMYHSIGGVVATGAALAAGASVFIRERFSARRFWDDIAERGCTLFQYIGELCRYLTDAPPHPRERAHRLRLACGNGLRGDVWEAFRDRFAIPQILEFYAATESNFSLYNCEGKPGAIGRIPLYLAHRFPVALVAFDVAADAPRRGPDGFCRRCGPDEAGEAIGKLPGDTAELAGRFEGYTDREASARKVLRDVFEPGDAWYRTGDLMRRDRAGYFYFVDRIGDTFRWKGENVATAEVEAAIGACPGVAEAVVYGVAVPGREGRAGMAAIVAGDGFDLDRLRRHLSARLPDYARPVFLRIVPSIALTGTFRPQKQLLAGDGFDPGVTGDALYFDDRSAGAYQPLDRDLYARIEGGALRL